MTAGWDCHAHLFGPYERYPLAADRSYTPPEAVEFAYLALLDRLRLSHGVLVHPSAYGDDHSLLFDTLEHCPQLRGVMVLRRDSPVQLDRLRERGVRATRFSHRSGAGANFAGSASFDDLLAMAPGWPTPACTPSCGPTARCCRNSHRASKDLPIPVVIDHMGGFDVTGWRGPAGLPHAAVAGGIRSRLGQALRLP